jgi:ABC-type sugar transport system ATPase subunit
MTRSLALQMSQIAKQYPGTVALHAVDFSVLEGEIKALLGENGAGKSTLVKILSGAVTKDSGEILIHGSPVHIQSPSDAIENGIGVIYQEFTLVPALSIAENIFLGRLPNRKNFVDWEVMEEKAKELLSHLGSQLDVRKKVSTLSVANRQLVEIAKALSMNANILIMDEPTAALSKNETQKLFETISLLKQKGVSIVYVSHRLEEIFEIADSVTILRDGEKVGDFQIGELTPKSIINYMIGKGVPEETNRELSDVGSVRLELIDANMSGVLSDVSLELHAGEILGITGLVGAGQTELARCLFGMKPLDSGDIRINGSAVRFRSPADAIAHGIGLIPEDRRQQGLVLGLPIRGNIILPLLHRVSRWFVVSRKQEGRIFSEQQLALNIKAVDGQQLAGKLSGGNQQKVVIAKWLASGASILIFHEPTRGIDVGAKEEIYHIIRGMARQQSCILIISSDMQEVLNVCDRLLVLRKGRIVKMLNPLETTKEEVLFYSTVSELASESN